MNLPWLVETPANQLSAVRDLPLAKLVRDHLQAMILRGELIAGQRINEPDVAAQLGISRVPVREALRELESTGLVVARKHAGVFVRTPDAAEVTDLYEMRGLLDGFAGRRVASQAKAARGAVADLLDASIKLMNDAAAKHEVQRYYSENLRFHWAIVEAAGNTVLAENYRGIVQKLHLSRLKNLSHDVGMRASIAEHVAIAAALRRGSVAQCEELMARHVGDAFTRLRGTAP
ncbi:MAG TPA: GntR family transcriptional regulator [Burkholderiaceae bacterium]